MNRVLRWSMIVTAVLCLGCLNHFHPLLRGRWMGDFGDTRWNMYLLEHQVKVLSDSSYPGSYTTAPFWTPDSRHNLAYSDLMVGGEPLYMPLRLFLSRDAAYQTFLVLCALANFAAFYLLVVEAGASPLAALGAAAVFAFGAHRVQHLVHTQFALQAWGVLALWCLLRFLKRGQAGYIAGMVLALGLQTATAAYAGYLLLIGMVIWGALWTVWNRGGREQLWGQARTQGFAWLGAATAGAIIPVLLLTPYWHMLGAALRREWWEVGMHASPISYWFEPLANTFGAWVWKAARTQSQSAGAAVWLAAAAGWAWMIRSEPARKDYALRMAAASSLTAVILLGLVTRPYPSARPLWYMIYLYLPGANDMRDIRRISMAANTFLIMAAGLAVGRMLDTARGRRLALALGILAVAENIAPHHYSMEKDWYAGPTQEIRAALKDASAGAAFLDPDVMDFAFNYNLQLVSQELNVPIINGTTGRYISGHWTVIRPADVASKGDRLDFDRFVYIVPNASEGELEKELKAAGLVFRNRGEHFAIYTPGPDNPVYDAAFLPVAPGEQKTAAGGVLQVPVVISNRSQYVWQTIGKTPTQAIYYVRADGAAAKETVGDVTDLPGMVLPGEPVLVRVNVRAPREQGVYRVRLGMIRQNRAFFGPSSPAGQYSFLLRVE